MLASFGSLCYDYLGVAPIPYVQDGFSKLLQFLHTVLHDTKNSVIILHVVGNIAMQGDTMYAIYKFLVYSTLKKRV